MEPTRIVLAEDHALVRAGIRALLERCEGIVIVGETGDGREALRLAAKERAHVLLTDISMPGLNGLEVAERAARELPDVRVIILSMHANEEYVMQALKAGAKGYVLKDADLAELRLAVQSVMRGKTFLSPSISRPVIDNYLARVRGRKDAPPPSGGVEPFATLTSRQREILQLIAEGNSNKDIARKLNLSVKTVDTHRTDIMRRLDIHDTAGLVRYAIRTGIVSST
jgi:DNA-binding NarL/FixJ family response regulator